MSFITKRERVFNEYDLFDLPARNEGKLKAYASCTDARAWSHFCSDKSEHLVEIIKRNNDSCRPKYVPTEAIVNTLMVGKNAEIARLKRKIEEFEQMLAAYDELELTCEQKCEIAKAHAAIKAANKDLDELCLDLDLSGFTEGIDSEAFETGKSRGDEPSRFQDDETPRSKGDETSYFLSQWTFEKEPTQKDTKNNQAGLSCPCDASTLSYIVGIRKYEYHDTTIARPRANICRSRKHLYRSEDQTYTKIVTLGLWVLTDAVDPRIQEMQDTIVTKDAKLNAMQNTIAVMENDVCEPYCIYAHIYTALEKIFGILCQNDKYKLYLELMTSGRDTRCIDIKGKILFKLKVLEKFSLALIAPCSQDFSTPPGQDCSCYRAEVITRVETAYALTSAESKQPCLDNKRAQLVADIMENDEMKEILSKENASLKNDLEIDEFETDNYNIDSENLKRLKNLQENYDDLMTYYEALKHEKDCLMIRCRKNEELEKEIECLKCQLREYSALWNEKEHYRRRSADLDTLKEQFMVLADETSNLEDQLKAESEFNNVKGRTIDELRRENFLLEQKLNEASMLFEKEKNDLQCKAMCQDQQIKSLSFQVDKLLEHDTEKEQSNETDRVSIALKDEINSLKEQITNLKDICFCDEEEKRQIQEEFKSQLILINDLKMQVEDWKSDYEKEIKRNDYLEKYSDNCRDELQRIIENNKLLTQNLEEKTTALENLNSIIKHKSQDVNRLSEDKEKLNNENSELYRKIQTLQETYNTALDNERIQTRKSLQLARQESQELLEKVKDYDDMVLKQDDLVISIQSQNEEYNDLKALFKQTQDQNKQKFENLSDVLQKLRDSHEILLKDKKRLESELYNKTLELNDALYSIQLKNQESEELVNKLYRSENLKTDLIKMNDAYTRIKIEKQALLNELTDKKNDFDELLQSFDNLQSQNKLKTQEVESLNRELAAIKSTYDNLLAEKNMLQSDSDAKSEEINNLYNNLEMKIEENKELSQRLQQNISTKNNLAALKKESDELIERVKYYEALESEYDKLKKDNDKIRAEKNNLERELNHQVTDLRRMERENHDLSTHSQELLSHSEVLEKALISARTELIVKSSLQDNPHVEVIKQIEEMKQEKLNQHNKIRDLLDKLDESENVISNQTEYILARDDRIAILENHINQLEDEVRKLHASLAEVVDTGEQITDHSSRKINQSLLSMEAHHSKATHNMKMELAKLQSENTMLEERLSATKMRNEETARDKHKYLSQISHLQNEREIIVTDIKQLEMRSVGDSALSPERCDVEDIISSLDRIRRYLDARSSKSTSLEQTLLSVQNSYQIVQNKTDEAKKIVEKEKQKIVNEKEEAIKDKVNMEKQLINLKEQLEQQISQDRNVIKDMEAEILNQKLIIDKVTQSTQIYISKLEDDMKSVQLLYEKALQEINTLKNQLQILSNDKSKHMGIIERTGNNLEEKIKEVALLNKTLAELKKEPGRNISIQTSGTPTNRNVESQANDEIKYEESDKSHLKEKYDNLRENKDINLVQMNKARDKKSTSNNTNKAVNEVQVLTANVDPTFDYVKSSYLNYKLQQLSPGRLEQYTISCGSESDMKNEGFSTPDEKSPSEVVPNPGNNSRVDPKNQNFKVIDIYNKKSMHTNSSKAIDNDDTENEVDVNTVANQIKSPNKSSAFTGFGLTNESLTESNINNEFKNSNIFGSTSEVSTDKDLFVIYKDSESNYDKSNEKKGPWNSNGQSEIVVEAVTVHHSKNDPKHHKRQRSSSKHGKKREIASDPFINQEDEEYEEDDSVKHKLKISLPRVGNDSPSVEASDAEKRSLDSYTMAIYPSPKAYSSSNYNTDSHIKFQGDQLNTPSTHSIPHDKYQYKDAANTKREKPRNVNKKESAKSDKKRYTEQKPVNRDNLNENKSHHTLSRVGADVLLIKSQEDRTDHIDSNSSRQQKSKDFALEYIIDSHNDPDNIKTYDAAKAVRKTRSDERFNLNKLPDRSEFSSPSRLSELKKSSTDYKTISSNTYSKSTDKSPPKSYNECSVMVKLDTAEEYENKIRHLTKTLENIEKDYKKKIDAIKMQYDNNIKSILNEHNQGVKSIQSLHEETLQDILNIHENEVENLRTMSIEAMRKADKLEKENKSLKNKMLDSSSCLDEEPIKISTPELKRRKRSRVDPRLLTKTTVEAFNVKPKSKSYGPCTCSLDINISDTIRNIFEQVDVEQRKMAEYTYLKYIANKIMNGNVDALDTQELSFLHLKVCRIWKTKLTKEESLQKRIDSLEAELMNKQKHAQQNIAELDRKVAEERRRLQEVREAVCRSTTAADQGYVPPVPPPTVEKDFLGCCCTVGSHSLEERRSAGDLAPVPSGLRPKRTRNESNRAVLAKLDVEERREREKKIYTDELPTRLRKAHDRPLRLIRK